MYSSDNLRRNYFSGFLPVGFILGTALAVFLFAFSPAAHAGALTGVSATSVTWATDNLIAQSSANWKFSMTIPTALNPNDVVQVTFPSITQGQPFTFANVTVSATSAIWLATTVGVGADQRTLGFTTVSSVATSTPFSITIAGIANGAAPLSQVAGMTWQFRTGIPTNPAAPADALSTVKDGPTNATQSLIRRGLGIVSDVNSGIVPSSYATGATNATYTFTFTATTTIPIGGKIALNFPPEYTLTSVTTTPQTDINGAAAGNPSVSSGAVTVVTSNGRNQVLLTTSNAPTGVGSTLTVQVTTVTNPSTINVYRPFYIYTTTAQGGVIDGAYFGFSEETYNGPPPVDSLHIGGTNNLIITVKKNPITGSAVILGAGEREQVKVGVGCPDKMFFVGQRFLTPTSSVSFNNLLDCNYMVFTAPTDPNNFTFWDSFLQPAFKEIPAAGGGVFSADLTFAVPNATLVGEVRGGVNNFTDGEIRAFNETHQAYDALYTSPAYTTKGLSTTGTGYFSVRARAGSTWQISIPAPQGTMMSSGGTEYWPPAIPAVILTASGTRSIGAFAYVVADKTLSIVLRKASDNSLITNACVAVKRTGGGLFMAPQSILCQPNTSTAYQFRVPEGSIAVEVMKLGGGLPQEYPVAVNTAAVTSTIFMSAPTSYIKVVVRDSDSRPISGVSVFAQSSSGYGQGLTDASGTATSYVPFGTYRVEGFAPGYGSLTAQTGVSVQSGTNPTVNLTLNTSGFRTITGRVFIDVGGAVGVYDDGTDTPLGSIQIGARGTGGTTGGNGTISASDGTYTLRVPAGTYSLGGWSSAYGGFPEQSVDVSAGNVSGINFSLAQTGTLEITVVGGADVSPLFAGAFSPTTGRGNGTDQWTASSTDKFTSLTFPAGTYELHIGSPAFGELTAAGGVSVTISAGAITATSYNVTSKVTLVTLSGTVTDSVAAPLANVNVWVSRTNGPGSFSTLTAANGTYTLKIPDTFTYNVGANRSGYLATRAQVTMAGNRTQNFTLAAAGSTIIGTIYDASNNVITNAWVWAEKTATSVWTGAPTDESGAYSLEVDGGTWTVFADGPCYLRSAGLAATAGNTGKNITLATNPLCSAPVPQMQSMTPANGGIISNGTAATVNIPANALGTGSDAVSVTISNTEIIPTSPNLTTLAGAVQTITALNASGQSISTLNSSADITLAYSEANLPVGFNENNLQVAYWDSTNKKWEPVAGTVDPDLNVITLQLDHFTDVGVGTPVVPATPQNVSALALANSPQINLSWNAVSGATNYKVYRASSSGGSFSLIASPTTNSYANTGLATLTYYYYKVTAVDASGESAYSAEVNAQTTNMSLGSPGGGGSSAAPATTPTATSTTSTATTTVPVTTTPTSTQTPTVPSASPRGDGVLIRYDGDTKVYVLESGKKRWIKTGDDFVKLGYTWNTVVVVSTGETYADGEAKVYTRGQITSALVRNLARGAKGPDVAALQQKLKDLGFFPANVAVIEFFGPTTQKALRAFQKAHGLAQVGHVGPQTRKLLNSL